MFYIKLALFGFWMAVGCMIGLFNSITRWGDTELGKEYARFFSKKALKVANIDIEYHGLENIEAAQPCIYTLNHQSNFDMALFGEVYPSNTVIIGKKELIWIPFFGLFYKSAGNIMIDRKKTSEAKSSLGQVVEEIKRRKVSVWIFPEGTRNTSKTLLPFKKGPFHMAIAAQVPVVPLISSTLSKALNWDEKKMPGGKMVVKILPPIYTNGMTEKDVDTLTQTVRQKMQEALDESNRLALT
ncbi:1-acyl-sn-glycerol-3-phosphate acyltransferase [bacterium]|nr:MAG: 1-acyl-sn-glycerol-3-phosphate acyltransferase [bacterium]